MDKQSILKFFNDNAQDAPQALQGQTITHNNTAQQGDIYIQYGDSYTTNDICAVADNDNLTCADKRQVYELIRLLEDKNKQPI